MSSARRYSVCATVVGGLRGLLRERVEEPFRKRLALRRSVAHLDEQRSRRFLVTGVDCGAERIDERLGG